MEKNGTWTRHEIGRVATHFNISLRTLRFYEQAGLLNPEKAGNTRLYSAHDRARTEMILTARRFGFTISEIFKLLEQRNGRKEFDIASLVSRDQMEDRLTTLMKRQDEIARAIQELQQIIHSSESSQTA